MERASGFAFLLLCPACHEAVRRQPEPERPAVETLATGQKDVVDIAVDDSGVYWGRGWIPDPAVYRLGQDGQPVLLARGDVLNVAVSGGNLFVGGTELRRVDLATAGVTVLARPQNGFISLSVDQDFVFWAPDGDEGGVYKSAKAGGEPVVLALGQSRVVDVEADADFAYFADTNGIKRVPRNGGDVEVLAAAESWNGDARLAPARIALDDTRVYWTVTNAGATEREGRVMSVAKAGGPPSVIAVDSDRPMGIAVDGAHVYWTRAMQTRNASAPSDPRPGAVVRAGVGGGDVEVIAADQNRPVAVTLDDENVYWVNGVDGSIIRMTKP